MNFGRIRIALVRGHEALDRALSAALDSAVAEIVKEVDPRVAYVAEGARLSAAAFGRLVTAAAGEAKQVARTLGPFSRAEKDVASDLSAPAPFLLRHRFRKALSSYEERFQMARAQEVYAHRADLMHFDDPIFASLRQRAQAGAPSPMAPDLAQRVMREMVARHRPIPS